MSDIEESELPTFEDVIAAARRLRGHAVVTPLLNAPLLDAELGGRLFVKAESLQRTGSFKFRGAYNRIALLGADERRRGVVAYSSGNHAQGVAAAARELGVTAVIVMPADAPAIKIARTKSYGAEVVLYDRYREAREEIAQALLQQRPMTLVPPYDDCDIVAGQGTVGNEIADQCAQSNVHADAVLVPASGGGLIAGSALALKRKSPETQILACEPEHYDDHAQSLAAGRRVSVSAATPSICDALMAPMPGELTWAVNRRLLAGSLVVSESDVRRAMAAAMRHLKLVVEPGGAAALAAVLARRYDIRGKTAVVVCSGGNVDPEMYVKILATA